MILICMQLAKNLFICFHHWFTVEMDFKMTTFFNNFLYFNMYCNMFLCDEGSQRWLPDKEFIWDEWGVMSIYLYNFNVSVSQLSHVINWGEYSGVQPSRQQTVSWYLAAAQNNSGWKLARREKNTRNDWDRTRGRGGRRSSVIFSSWSLTRLRTCQPAGSRGRRSVLTRW